MYILKNIYIKIFYQFKIVINIFLNIINEEIVNNFIKKKLLRNVFIIHCSFFYLMINFLTKKEKKHWGTGVTQH